MPKGFPCYILLAELLHDGLSAHRYAESGHNQQLTRATLRESLSEHTLIIFTGTDSPIPTSANPLYGAVSVRSKVIGNVKDVGRIA